MQQLKAGKQLIVLYTRVVIMVSTSEKRDAAEKLKQVEKLSVELYVTCQLREINICDALS